MRIGIDFGTSNTAAAIYQNGKVRYIEFNGQRSMPTVVFFREELDDDVRIDLTTEKNSILVDEMIRQLKSEDARMIADRESRRSEIRERYNARIKATRDPEEKQRLKQQLATELEAAPSIKPRPADGLRSQAQSSVRNKLINDEMERRAASRGSMETALFGFEALESIADGTHGRILQSPKSMLGFTLGPGVEDLLCAAVKKILLHIRTTAEQQLRSAVTEAVIGRPFRFKCASELKSAERTEQALRIITRAALEAGFQKVEFLQEPVAASLRFQNTLRSKKHALVVDIGGGTTDVASVELGGGDVAQVDGGVWGFALGGQDIDTELSLASLMPLFGSTELDLHKGYLSPMDYGNAARPYDLQRQRDFKNKNLDRVPHEVYQERLKTLQADGNTTRLIGVAEKLKIDLSSNETSEASLEFIESHLSVSATRAHLGKAAAGYIAKLEKLLKEIGQTISPAVELIVLTGGMSQSPWVEDVVRSCFPGIKIVTKEASLGVVAGLAIHAGQ